MQIDGYTRIYVYIHVDEAAHTLTHSLSEMCVYLCTKTDSFIEFAQWMLHWNFPFCPWDVSYLTSACIEIIPFQHYCERRSRLAGQRLLMSFTILGRRKYWRTYFLKERSIRMEYEWCIHSKIRVYRYFFEWSGVDRLGRILWSNPDL